MNQLVKMSAFAVAACLTASAFGQTVLKTEHFDTDPTARGWSGVNNVSPDPNGDPNTGPIGNDYGFKMTDDSGTAVLPPGGTATGAGEIGGVFTRAPNSFYGVNLGGEIDFNTTNMNVKGVLRQMHAEGSSTLNLGWTRGYDAVNNLDIDPDSGEIFRTPKSSLYVSWDDGAAGSAGAGGGLKGTTATGASNGLSADIPSLVSGDPTRPFEFDWNATTKTFSFTLGADPASTAVLTADQVTAMGKITHWGLWGRTNNDGISGGADPHDNGNQLRLDDITFTAVGSGGVAGDFNADAVVNATDIDLLCDRINAGTGPIAPFDVDGNGAVNTADVNFEVTSILHTKFGDTDTDGDVDLSDLGNLATGFGVAGEKRWSRGNFDCDLDVDLNDLGTLATNFQAGRAAAFAQFEALVPEPASAAMLGIAAIGLAARSRRRVV